MIHIKAAPCRIVEAFIEGAGVTSIPLETLASVVGSAPAVDGPVAPRDLDDAPKPADHGERAALEDCTDDPADFDPVAARAEINADRMEEAPAADGAGRDDCAKYGRTEALAIPRPPRDRRAAADRAGIPRLVDDIDERLDARRCRLRNLRTHACDIALVESEEEPMLTISLERVVDILDKAQEVELPEPTLLDDGAEAALEEAGAIDELLADDPAYQTLTSVIATLTPGEACDLLALALLERNAAELDEWQAMLEQAREVPEDQLADQIVETLLLTDDIELALERLGYIVDDEDEAEDDAEDSEADEEGEPEVE